MHVLRRIVAFAIVASLATEFVGCEEQNTQDGRLPDFAAALASAKSACESAAKQIKSGRRRLRSAKAGEQLYSQAKTDSDSLIAFLCAGLETKFNGTSIDQIRAHLLQMESSTNQFLRWARKDRLASDTGNESEPAKPSAAVDPFDVLGDLISSLPDWYARIKQAEENRIRAIKTEIRRSQFRAWQDL